MSDCRDKQENVHPATGHFSNRDISASLPTTAIPFRLMADFVVEAGTANEFLLNPETTPEERDLLLCILTDPEALDRMCRLAIVCDLKAYGCGLYFEDTFMGPDPEDVLDCVLPYLPADLQEYWTRLRMEQWDRFSSEIDNVFV